MKYMDGKNTFDARRAIHIPDASREPRGNTAKQEHLAHLEGHILGGCRLVRLLSSGGMSEVYLGEQIRLGNRLVAVKVVRPEEAVAPASDAIPNMETMEARFMREGRLLGQFSHPNILPVHDSGLEGGYLYLVMQYTPDGSLADALRGAAPHRLNLPVRLPLAVDIIEQLASALQYTHDHGIVHRDVKPANVLIQREPMGHRRMLLADFGIARGMESTAQWGQITGTVTYMAPEQFSGKFSPASDQYALAVVAFLLLAGRPPFTGDVAEVTRAHLYDAPFSLRSFNPKVPHAVGQVVARALAKYPEQRYPSVSLFAQAFRHAATGDEAGAETTVPGVFPLPLAGMGTGGAAAAVAGDALMGAEPSRGATYPAPDGSTQPADGLLVKPNGETKVIAMVTEVEPRRSIPSSQWRGVNDDGGVWAAASEAARRSDTRRRVVVFAICAALLAIAMVAAIKLGPLYTSSAGSTTTSTAPIIIPPGTAQPVPSSAPSASATVQPAVSPDKAYLISLSAPQRVAPSQRFNIVFTIANSGSTAWSDADGYRLVCDTLNHPQNFCPRSLSVSLGNHTIVPGQRAQFTLTLIAPSQTGTYTTWVNMARDSALFSTPDVTTHFVAQVPPPEPTATSLPAPTGSPHPTPATTPAITPTISPVPKSTPHPAPTATSAPAATNTPAPVPTATATSAPPSTLPPATATPGTTGAATNTPELHSPGEAKHSAELGKP